LGRLYPAPEKKEEKIHENICERGLCVGKGLIALDPTFESFTLLEPVSH
jgi:hypothetical protein